MWNTSYEEVLTLKWCQQKLAPAKVDASAKKNISRSLKHDTPTYADTRTKLIDLTLASDCKPAGRSLVNSRRVWSRVKLLWQKTNIHVYILYIILLQSWLQFISTTTYYNYYDCKKRIGWEFPSSFAAQSTICVRHVTTKLLWQSHPKIWDLKTELVTSKCRIITLHQYLHLLVLVVPSVSLVLIPSLHASLAEEILLDRGGP